MHITEQNRFNAIETTGTVASTEHPVALADVLRQSIAKENTFTLISGETGSGKTSLIIAIQKYLEKDGLVNAPIITDFLQEIPDSTNVMELNDNNSSLSARGFTQQMLDEHHQIMSHLLREYDGVPEYDENHTTVLIDLLSEQSLQIAVELLAIGFSVVMTMHAHSAEEAIVQLKDYTTTRGYSLLVIKLDTSYHQTLVSDGLSSKKYQRYAQFTALTRQ